MVSLKKRVSFAFTGSPEVLTEQWAAYGTVLLGLFLKSSVIKEVKIYLQHMLHFWKNFFFYFFVLSQRSPSSFPMLSQRCPETKITWHPKISQERAKANTAPWMEQRNVSSLPGALVWPALGRLCSLHAGAFHFCTVPFEASESNQHLLLQRALQLYTRNPCSSAYQLNVLSLLVLLTVILFLPEVEQLLLLLVLQVY